ncbi:MAG: cryptochrome/photolyase family protein [candidate division KSB1 bacterium]
MSVFRKELATRASDPSNRRWLFVPYDQLTDAIGPLAREAAQSLGLVLVESAWKAARRPYHKQKLALVLANMRRFALEQAERGVAIKYVFTRDSYRAALAPLVQELGAIRVMQPAEYELRVDLQPLIASGGLQIIPHEGWLTTPEQFRASMKNPPWRMDAFYRHVRRATGVLMENGKPVGGKFSFDADNRQPWKGEPAAPIPPTFSIDPLKAEVGALIEKNFAPHPGVLHLEQLPCTLAEAETLWQWAKKNCLPLFGPYEDAMSTASRGLFHTRLSALMNLHRLLPARVVAEVEKMNLPLASKEGFIRQVLGWREFVRHVHEATQGFRKLPSSEVSCAKQVGDGGYARWAKKSWPVSSALRELDGGAKLAALGENTPLPPAYWGARSGLACLDHVVKTVWEEGYSHHITRLMVLANIATLLDVSPRELTDWFGAAYTDAYDWVVEPNVLGMGTFALGDFITTKPYISGAAYIHRMSDYCAHCAFDPKKNCPLTNLYWAKLARHEQTLAPNQRMKLALASMRKRPAGQRERDQKIFEQMRKRLIAGEVVTPENLPKSIS